jgi:hypothetical protein
MAKQRWIIERDYQELKQELGLGHYEGRGWRGFHHHATLCIAAYGFLVIERNRFSPLTLNKLERVYLSPDKLTRSSSSQGLRAGNLGLSALRRPPGSVREDHRVRPERHNPTSIATIRQTIARQLLRRLECCPFCGSPSG